jgi:ribonuclease J
MKIKIHRGTHQIGGCVTEIRTDSTRIFIDMGAELPGNESNNPDRDFEIDGLTFGESNCDGVFFTHTHGDHIGLFDEILPGIPLYCGEIAKEIFVCLQERLKKHNGKPELARTFSTFLPGQKLVIGDAAITPIKTDHSAYDAYMFLIEADGQKVLHTGDFRDHGPTGKGVGKALPTYVGNVDVLITEGTMFSRSDEKILSEFELQHEATKILKDEQFTFVMCSSTNIDRIAAFCHAAKNNGRVVLCDAYQKSVLDIVTKTRKTDYYDFGDVLVDDMKNKEQQAKIWKNGAVFFVRKGSWRNYKGFIEKKDGLLIYSMWHGYLHGKSKDEELAEIVKSVRHKSLHTSGHATISAIQNVIDITTPSIIIPIHSEAPEEINKLNTGSGAVKYLKDGEEMEI